MVYIYSKKNWYAKRYDEKIYYTNNADKLLTQLHYQYFRCVLPAPSKQLASLCLSS